MEGWKRDELLAPHTTLKVGGPAEYFTTVQTEEELTARIREANARRLPITILGGGSNVLVSDDGIRGAVIKNAITGIDATEEGDTVKLTAGAGEVFDDVVAATVARGLWGIENLSHIPGSVGATPVQNVGAYGVEVADVITAVRAFDTETLSMVDLAPAACVFGYRDSIFKHAAGKRYVVTAVTFALSRTPRPHLSYKDLQVRFGDAPEPSQQEVRNAVIEIRAKKFPDWTRVGTAGSFFKNPIVPRAQYASLSERYPGLPGFPVHDDMVKVPLGWILDNVCDLRGVREGNVGTYEGQALVVVNWGGATAREINTFADRIARDVYDRTGITIEWEVTKI